jgi:hypothetical protein
MLTHGFAKAEVRKAFAARPTSIHGFDLVRSLAIPAPPPAFTRYYDMLEINDVMTLVNELARLRCGAPWVAGGTRALRGPARSSWLRWWFSSAC